MLFKVGIMNCGILCAALGLAVTAHAQSASQDEVEKRLREQCEKLRKTLQSTDNPKTGDALKYIECLKSQPDIFIDGIITKREDNYPEAILGPRDTRGGV